MWTRKEIKKSGKLALKGNYLRCVIVSLIILAITGGFVFSRGEEVLPSTTLLNYRGATNTQIVNETARGLLAQNKVVWEAVGEVNNARQGALASIFNNATASGSFLFGLLNALNQLLFNDQIGAGIIIAIGAVVTFLFYLFVQNILQVGEYRFYLENRRFRETKIDRVLYLYKIRRVRRVALIMFLRALYTVLWFFTIVGGFIKIYSYRMVPFILAENPDVSRKEAFRLSREMMRGNKWRCFLLDLSFFWWYLLSSLTFHILGVLYLNPYYTATNAELYMHLRDAQLATHPATAISLNDTLLNGPISSAEKAEYPTEFFSIPEHPNSKWLGADYHCRYSLTDYILLFFAFSLIGYLWEVLYYLVKSGAFINRGTLYGPWLPIYGCGGVAVVALLRRWADRPVLTFFLVMGVCGVMEYATAWFLETFLRIRWWDYTGYFLNIHGRVCLEGLLVFGLAGCLGIYLLAPSLSNLFRKIPKKARILLCLALIALFLLDFGISLQHPNMAAGEALQ